MARTRASKPTTNDSQDVAAAATDTSKYSVETSEAPSKMFILPKKASKEAKIITLPHPRTSKPNRYLVCQDTGFYEFTQITAPKNAPRSWLIGSTDDEGQPKGQVASSGDLFVATPIDPVFLLIPALAESSIAKSDEEQKRLFLSSDDYFDRLPEESSHLNEALRWEKSRALLESRMGAICDTVDAGDETMYRLNKGKIVSVCLEKAKKLADGNFLPPSLEKQFVSRPLQAPVLSQKRTLPSSESQASNDNIESGSSTPKTESNDSQSTTASAETAATSVDGEIEAAIKPTEEVIDLQRLRVAFDFLCQRLISPAITTWLKAGLTDDQTASFKPLEDYLSKVAELRAEALASRSMGGYSRKHARDEDEDEAREQKKRKLEEEKKKKANESRGVRDLKKVNTTGMKKLSHFFQKKT